MTKIEYTIHISLKNVLVLCFSVKFGHCNMPHHCAIPRCSDTTHTTAYEDCQYIEREAVSEHV